MKTWGVGFVTFICYVLLPFAAGAQIPNGGFEQWTSGEPDEWKTSNIPNADAAITRSTASYSGSFALRGEVKGPLLPVVVQSGAEGRGFAVSQRHKTVSGFFQFQPAGGDQFTVDVFMFLNGNGIGSGAIAISESTSSYIPFNLDVSYFSADVPETCIVKIAIIGPGTGSEFHTGTSLLLDDLSFSGVVGVREDGNAQGEIPARFSLEQNYPNPFNPSSEIRYQISDFRNVRLAVYDLLGREVAVLVDEKKAPGTYTVQFDGRGLSSGVYLYRMQSGDFIQTRTLLLLR